MPFPPLSWFALAIALGFLATAHAGPPQSFSNAKKQASIVYKDHRTTFYCGCSFDAKNRVDPSSCGYTPRKNAKRGKRIEWEHVVPAKVFGGTRACWRADACTSKRGKTYGGRRCCQDSDPLFRAMENDLNNLVPAVGELNGDRSHLPFGIIPGEARAYGACDLEIDFERNLVEPRAEIRGDIARIYFYMREKYGIPLEDDQRKLFEAWDKEDPQDPWERAKATRIGIVEGQSREGMR